MLWIRFTSVQQSTMDPQKHTCPNYVGLEIHSEELSLNYCQFKMDSNLNSIRTRF